MESIKDYVDAEKNAKRVNKLNQTQYLKIYQQIINQHNNLKSIKSDNLNDLSSLLAFYEHQILDISDLPLNRVDHFNSVHCLFCDDKSKKKFKLKSFKENKKRVTYLFKICSKCGKWEKLHDAKMIKPIKSKLNKFSKFKKHKLNSQLNKSSESNKLTKFNLNDLKKLKSNLNN